jgi:hypothetical protein
MPPFISARRTANKEPISRLKVSEKGAVSLYSIGRFLVTLYFPVSLYKEQWAKILGMVGEIEAFIRENDHLLKAKE